MKRTVALLLVTVFAACGQPGTELPVRISGSEAPLTGTWELVQVGGDSPSASNIHTWVVSIQRKHKWKYSGTMSGPWAGMSLAGEGTWHLSTDGGFEYTAGDNRGLSRLR